MVNKPTRVQENKVVMAKLTRRDFIKLQKHCSIKKETVNAVVKKAVMAEIESPIPHMLAGRNIFIYNKYKDNYSWKVILDNGLRIDIEDDLPAEYVTQLFDSLKQAVDERNTYIKKQNKDGVPIPSKLVRKEL
ncbi:hypothetical protein KO465_03275 [Candidatus Micrarchaeota archaeon]|nr:hypothetical protein [Candidatus Micrarchaeota archaeon]